MQLAVILPPEFLTTTVVPQSDGLLVSQGRLVPLIVKLCVPEDLSAVPLVTVNIRGKFAFVVSMRRAFW